MVVIYGRTVEAFYFGCKLASQGQPTVIIAPESSTKGKYAFPMIIPRTISGLIHPADAPVTLSSSSNVKLSYMGDSFMNCATDYPVVLCEESAYLDTLAYYFTEHGGKLLTSSKVTFDLNASFITCGNEGYRFEQIILAAIPEYQWFIEQLENYSLWHKQGIRAFRKDKDWEEFTLVLGINSDQIGYRVMLEDVTKYMCYGVFGTSEPELKSLNASFNVRAKFLSQHQTRLRIGSMNQAKRFMSKYPQFYCCGLAYGCLNPVFPQSGFNIALQDHMLQTNDFIGLDSGNILKLVRSEYIAKLLTTPLGVSRLVERLDTMTEGK